MSILLACPTRGRIWWETAMRFAELAGDVDNFLVVQNNRSIIEARNEINRAFLESGADFLLSIDDDILPHANVLNLAELFSEVPELGLAAAPCALLRPGLPVLPNMFRIDESSGEYAIDMRAVFDERKPRIYQPDAVGFGCVMISRTVAEQMPRFKMRYDEEGVPYMGEDIDYCLQVREAGFQIAADLELLSDHVVEVHAGGVAQAFTTLLNATKEDPIGGPARG